MATYQQFYENRVDGNYLADSPSLPLQSHYYYRDLKCFIDENGLAGKRCLEIGSGIGRFQDMVDDYWGADVSAGVGVNYHKNYVVHGGNGYPSQVKVLTPYGPCLRMSISQIFKRACLKSSDSSSQAAWCFLPLPGNVVPGAVRAMRSGPMAACAGGSDSLRHRYYGEIACFGDL